ncbi:class B sortase [Ruminococcaceae bacterium OttesenSCG-928-A11]|nr:class B sortase [Ruminococcaceae bacterium OttesenSCG-928-A11]
MKINVEYIGDDEYEEYEELDYDDDAISIPVRIIKPKDSSLEKPIKKKRKKAFHRVFAIILICLSLALLATSTIFIVNWYIDNHRIDELKDEFSEVDEVSGGEPINPPEDTTSDYWDFIKIPLINVDFNELLNRNSDTVSWINIKSTNINYPVVQTSDNDYYLTHAFDKSYNQAGWVFADYRNNMNVFDTNTIIYGHSRYDGTMFGSLKNVLSDSWYTNRDNRVIRLSTPYANTMWQVFSVYRIEPETYYLSTSFANNNSHQFFLDTITSRSHFNFNASPNINDKIITISTCANNLQNDRIVLHAKLIKAQNR